MSPSTRGLVVELMRRAADAWAEGNEARGQTWCARAWALAGDEDFVDIDNHDKEGTR